MTEDNPFREALPDSEKLRILLPEFNDIIRELADLGIDIASLELTDNYQSSYKAIFGLTNLIFKLNTFQKKITAIYSPLAKQEAVLKKRKENRKYYK